MKTTLNEQYFTSRFSSWSRLSRLAVLRESNDGFVIAEKDLEIRGPGELLGTKQV